MKWLLKMILVCWIDSYSMFPVFYCRLFQSSKYYYYLTDDKKPAVRWMKHEKLDGITLIHQKVWYSYFNLFFYSLNLITCFLCLPVYSCLGCVKCGVALQGRLLHHSCANWYPLWIISCWFCFISICSGFLFLFKCGTSPLVGIFTFMVTLNIQDQLYHSFDFPIRLHTLIPMYAIQELYCCISSPKSTRTILSVNCQAFLLLQHSIQVRRCSLLLLRNLFRFMISKKHSW